MDTPPPAPPTRKRIAVIAVHGVADQKPNESNAAIASMLVQHGERPGTAHGRYTPFVTHEVHLPQFPVIPPPEKGIADAGHAAGEETSRRHGRWQILSNRDYIENTLGALGAAGDAPVDFEAAADGADGDPNDAAGELGY
ncbi:MAG TPA: hypothetical protein VF613_13405, partial [Longimicrobium sp.]